VVGGAKDVEGLSAEEMFKIFDTDNDGKIGTADFSLLHKHIVKHLLGERNESRKKKVRLLMPQANPCSRCNPDLRCVGLRRRL